MRLVRVGEPTAEVGGTVRAALTSWGRGSTVAGGVALLGVRPPGFGSTVEAVLLLPRGVFVVIGVDLPDPAMRLSAPMTGPWRIDGWPLTRPDGPVNPADGALSATAAVADLVRAAQPRPLPVHTVVAVGPYVGEVDQPAEERGIRILHPEPMPLLAVTRDLATHSRACMLDEARRILFALHQGHGLDDDDLVAEGFPDGLSPEAGAASTTILPRVPGGMARPEPRRRKRWLPVTIGVVVALLLVAGIAVAVAADDSPMTPARPASPPAFVPRGFVEQSDCAAHTDGAIHAWLERNGCAALLRGRFETTDQGKRAAVLVGVVRITGSTSATELMSVTTRPDAGGVLDVEGVPWPGGLQPVFAGAARVSGQEGNSVKLAQAVWLDEPSRADDPLLREIASRALRLSLSG
ncbi:hypothetical protein [Actinokineospora enzanensis]|uniref:hypothetical protein n=1 Tax=Actinokineospora enzanensis TaxID=155975 RepID=UPI000360E323|nr:hypothetical protein [Actinokineospora enzanensis]